MILLGLTERWRWAALQIDSEIAIAIDLVVFLGRRLSCAEMGKMRSLLMLTLLAFSMVMAAERPGLDNRPAQEKKLLGAWIGQSPCAGQLLVRADGVYQYYGFGPGGGAFEVGTWKVDWKVQPPILTMAPANEEETRQLHIVQIDDRQLDFRTVNPATSRLESHRRATQQEGFAIRIKILDAAVQRYLGTHDLGAGVNYPPSLKTLVDKKIIPASALLDPWGKEFQYDRAGKHQMGKRPDIWTTNPGTMDVVSNWSEPN